MVLSIRRLRKQKQSPAQGRRTVFPHVSSVSQPKQPLRVAAGDSLQLLLGHAAGFGQEGHAGHGRLGVLAGGGDGGVDGVVRPDGVEAMQDMKENVNIIGN